MHEPLFKPLWFINEVFEPFLRKFALVFFDDIRANKDLHVEHMRLGLLAAHHLYANKKKSVFGQICLAYLGHVISAKGVATDHTKVQAVLD